MTNRRRSESRPNRIKRIARKFSKRAERQGRGGIRKPLMRIERNPKVRGLIAYDLETSRIAAGNPRVKYLTAYSDFFSYSGALTGLEHFAEVLRSRFLIPEFHRCRFVAWNGNNFDVYFVAMALLKLEGYGFRLKPYLTRGKNLRGLRVELTVSVPRPRSAAKKRTLVWEFLDGIAMTGAQGISLARFVASFAPAFPKLESPDWENEEFDASNPKHVAYADRDSEGLWHAMMNAQAITVKHFNMPLQPTIGNLGIKIFQSKLPVSACVWAPPFEVTEILRGFVMRGGFTFCQKPYQGPVWKFDINQAYAAAMRETDLPSGRCVHSETVHPYAMVYIVKVRAVAPSGNVIPFYCRTLEGKAAFVCDALPETWITSVEHKQLVREGWRVEILDSYFWDETFRMKEYVDQLESLRTKGPDGKDDSQGQMMKYIGNNSYGKTVEQLDGIDIVMANERPDGYSHYQADDPKLECLWFKMETPQFRDYHRPQVGAFITAYIRMVVRRAALQNPRAWLYADTDCVMFSEPVTSLDTDPRRYGAWKVESEGAQMLIITDKVYYDLDKDSGHAKGMNVARLSRAAFERWFDGSPPKQTQTQRANFVKTILGEPMFFERTKVGQII